MKIIKYFSLKQSWHTPVTWLNGLALLTIFQLTSNWIFWSSNVQMYLDNAVAFLGFLVLKLDLWFRHLSLKLVAVSPMYVSVFPSPLLIVAWYTTPSCKHFPSTGHSFPLLQLQYFSINCGPWLFLYSLKIFELCPLIVLARLGHSRILELFFLLYI